MPQMSPFAAFILFLAFLVLPDLQSSFHTGRTQNRSNRCRVVPYPGAVVDSMPFCSGFV